MKRCLKCTQVFETLNWHCPRCGWQPEISGGVPVFSPELARNSSGFRASYFEHLEPLEAGHFWFRMRNALIIWALGKYGSRVSSFMEIGCGTGFVLQGIARGFPNIHLVGSEIYPAGILCASKRITRGEFMQMDARQIPFAAEFDAIGAFDVLEHIEEDETVLQQVYQALKPGGLLMITAPQHHWLWSSVDVNACHVRRYSSHELHAKVTRAGFTIVRSSSFITSLLPLMLISRLLKRHTKESLDVQAELRINPILNRIFESFVRGEFLLIRTGVSLPIGGSLFLLAQKP